MVALIAHFLLMRIFVLKNEAIFVRRKRRDAQGHFLRWSFLEKVIPLMKFSSCHMLPRNETLEDLVRNKHFHQQNRRFSKFVAMTEGKTWNMI